MNEADIMQNWVNIVNEIELTEDSYHDNEIVWVGNDEHHSKRAEIIYKSQTSYSFRKMAPKGAAGFWILIGDNPDRQIFNPEKPAYHKMAKSFKQAIQAAKEFLDSGETAKHWVSNWWNVFESYGSTKADMGTLWSIMRKNSSRVYHEELELCIRRGIKPREKKPIEHDRIAIKRDPANMSSFALIEYLTTKNVGYPAEINNDQYYIITINDLVSDLDASYYPFAVTVAIDEAIYALSDINLEIYATNEHLVFIR